MKELKEELKPIQDYKGLYEISNYGYVRSFKRKGNWKDRILKGGINWRGYRMVGLYKDGKHKTYKMSLLVWDHFGDRPRNGHLLQVDHKDNNKQNDRIDNLQLLTDRENTSKGYLQNGKKTSRFTGVCWDKSSKKWVAKIYINNKRKVLGYFIDEKEASNKYQEALKNIFRKQRRK